MSAIGTRWIDRYMVVPFVRRGRDWNGCDCIGLYQLVLATEARLTINAPAELGLHTPVCSQRAVDSAILFGRFVAIVGANVAEATAKARCFDAVLMTAHVMNRRTGSIGRADLHLGCATGNGYVLHIEDERGPQLVAIDDPEIAHRIRGVYRPAALVERAA
jgi:hypothetical protein